MDGNKKAKQVRQQVKEVAAKIEKKREQKSEENWQKIKRNKDVK